MNKYPTENGRIVNPYNAQERPTFLPGDKVLDRRDASRRTFRIVSRVAHWDTELMTLREAGDDTHQFTGLASSLVPHLEMVAMSITPSVKGLLK